MDTRIGGQNRLEQIDSDAEFVLFSEEHGLISEHCTVAEARMAFFKQAAEFSLGERLPRIYQRHEPDWVPLSWAAFSLPEVLR